MMQITFTGSAEEVRAEMMVLLGVEAVSPVLKAAAIKLADVAEQPVASVSAPSSIVTEESKRGRGRPKKEERELVSNAPTPQPEVQSPEVAPEPEPEQKLDSVITYTEQDQAAAKEALKVLKEVVKPAPVEPEPEAAPEQSDVPANATDLMSAVMRLVQGDSAKKIALVKLLQEYGARTINTLDAANYPAFWAKVQQL